MTYINQERALLTTYNVIPKKKSFNIYFALITNSPYNFTLFCFLCRSFFEFCFWDCEIYFGWYSDGLIFYEKIYKTSNIQKCFLRNSLRMKNYWIYMKNYNFRQFYVGLHNQTYCSTLIFHDICTILSFHIGT